MIMKTWLRFYHDGIHTCVASQLFLISGKIEEKVHSGGTTITKSTEGAIIDCFKKENPRWNDVYRIANSTLEQGKLNYANKKS